jgi:hypothetical protein
MGMKRKIMTITNYLKNQIKIIKGFPRNFKLTLLAVIVIFTLFKIYNFRHPGFYFDTVATQYEWAKNATEMGFYNFWKHYTGFFDYLPGSLYFLMALEYLAKFVGGSYMTFIFFLKSFNFLTEIIFTILVIFVAQKYGKVDNKKAYSFGMLAFALPGMWFISDVWGQIDTFVVLINFIAILLLYRGEETTKNKWVLISGLVWGLAIWVKWQSLMLLPIYALYHLSKRDMKSFIHQFSGVIISSFLILIIPLISNVERVKEVILLPFTKETIVSRFASTFWRLIGIDGSVSDKVVSIGNFSLTVEAASSIIFIILMLVLVKKFYKFKFFNNDSKLKRAFTFLFSRKQGVLESIFSKKLTFTDFILLATINCSVYFMFATKMHSRYLHLGLLLSIISIAAIGTMKGYKTWIYLAIILNFSYSLNQLYVIAINYKYISWVNLIYKVFSFDLLYFASLVNFIAILGMYIWVYKREE